MKRSRLQWDTERRRRTRRYMDEARVLLLERSGGRCEAEFSPHCTGVGTDAHHIRPADRDEGRHEADRMRWLCRWCHQEVHANPALAGKAGLLAKSWEEPCGPA